MLQLVELLASPARTRTARLDPKRKAAELERCAAELPERKHKLGSKDDGPRSLEELFSWPFDCVSLLCDGIPQAAALAHFFGVGIDLVSHYSGWGTDHWALHCLVEALRVRGVPAKLTSSHSSDSAWICREALLYAAPPLRSDHVFGAFEDRFPPDLIAALQSLQSVPATRKSPKTVAERCVDMAALVDEAMSRDALLSEKTRARCWAHDRSQRSSRLCPVFDATPKCKGGESESERAFTLAVAGNSCVDTSSVGSKAGLGGDSFLPLLLWMAEMLHRAPDFILNECTQLWKVEYLLYFLGRRYLLLFTSVISPEDIGWPCRKARRYSVLMRKDLTEKYTFTGSPEHFFLLMGKDVLVPGDILLGASEEQIEHHKSMLARRRKNFRDDAAQYQLEELLTPCQMQRVQEYEAMRIDNRPFISDIGQNPKGGSSIPGQCWPSPLTTSMMFSNSAGRPATREEIISSMGLPAVAGAVVEKNDTMLRFPLQALLDREDVQHSHWVKMTGNSMHAAVLGTTVAYVLAHVQALETQVAAHPEEPSRSSSASDAASSTATAKLHRRGMTTEFH